MSRGGPPMPLGAHLAQARGALEQLAQRAGITLGGEPRAYLCGSCGVNPVGPRPGTCRDCQRREVEIWRAEQLAERCRIPPTFRWARLDLAVFAWPGVTTSIVHPEAVRKVRAFRGRLLVLRGETGAGKTSLACARLFAEAEQRRSAILVKATELYPGMDADAEAKARAAWLHDAALESDVVLLDDLGGELGGAPVGSPLAAVRCDAVRRLVRDLSDDIRPGKLVIVTVGLQRRRDDRGNIVGDDLEAYGGDVARRLGVYDRSPDVLTLGLGGA